MLVTCPRCNRLYDDEYRWTICPHRRLEADPAQPDEGSPLGYCERHDLYHCPFHERPS